MTPEQMRVIIAEQLGTDKFYYVVKRGLYYRPGAHGYTSDRSEAWVLTETEAAKHVSLIGDEPVTMQYAETPNYPADLNACAEMEKSIELPNGCMPFKWYLEIGKASNDTSERASAPQRCEAFIRTVCPEKLEEAK